MTDPHPVRNPIVQLHRRRMIRNRLMIAAAVALLLILRLVGCFSEKQAPSPAPTADDDFTRYDNRTVTCVKVLDGDTVDIDVPDLKAKRNQAYTRVRLWGIDTPEIEHFGKPAMHFGHPAAEFARKLMAGKKVRLQLVLGYTRDKFGRLLAYIHLPDGRMYNRLALDEGYAYAETRFKHPLRDEFVDRETQARRDLRGLWQSVIPEQIPRWYKASRLKNFWTERRQKPQPTSPAPR